MVLIVVKRNKIRMLSMGVGSWYSKSNSNFVVNIEMRVGIGVILSENDYLVRNNNIVGEGSVIYW